MLAVASLLRVRARSPRSRLRRHSTERVMIHTFAVKLRRAAATMAVVATVAGGLLGAEPASAHHSFAGFDLSRKVSVTGTVKEWQFTNPHSWLQLIVMEGGQPVEYGIEGASVSTLVRRGWTTKTFKT